MTRRTARPLSVALGSVLVLGAFLDSVFGRPSGTLSWGPVLFRWLLALHGLLLIAATWLPPAEERTKTRSPLQSKSLAVLGVISLVAIALRIPGLDSSMWLDEVLTLVRFVRPPASQILTTFPDQNQHMLYSLLAHGAIRIFGEQVWALRLPSVVFGVGSIWALFLLGRRLVSEKEALLACALMTVSYHHIWFSENARGYMGLLFFTLVATWLWLEAMDQDSWPVWMSYTLSIVLGIWIHMTMLFVVGTHALIFVLRWARSRTGRDWGQFGRAMLAFFLFGTLTLQIYALALPEFLRTGLAEFSPPSEWTKPLWVVQESLRSLQAGFAGLTVVLCGALLVAVGWVGLLRRHASAAWAMVVPGISGGGLMLAFGHNLWPRFFFFCMGFGLLIVVHGAMDLPRVAARIGIFDRRWAAKAGYAMAGMIIVASAITVPRCYALPKQDFTGARSYVEQALRPGDAVAVAGLAEHAYAPYYAPSWRVVHSPQELAALQANANRTFLVYTLPIELRAAEPDLWKAIQTGFDTQRIFWGTLGGGEVYVCRDHNRAGEARLQRH